MTQCIHQTTEPWAAKAPLQVRRTRYLVQVVDRAGELVCTVDPRRSLDEQLAIAEALARVPLATPRASRVCISVGKEGPAFGGGLKALEERSIEIGQRLARKIFERRGNPSEVGVTELQLAALLGFAAQEGMREVILTVRSADAQGGAA